MKVGFLLQILIRCMRAGSLQLNSCLSPSEDEFVKRLVCVAALLLQRCLERLDWVELHVVQPAEVGEVPSLPPQDRQVRFGRGLFNEVARSFVKLRDKRATKQKQSNILTNAFMDDSRYDLRDITPS